MCLRVKTERLATIEPTKKFAEGLTPLQKLDALRELIGEEDPTLGPRTGS
jgi:hypothetical protein